MNIGVSALRTSLWRVSLIVVGILGVLWSVLFWTLRQPILPSSRAKARAASSLQSDPQRLRRHVDFLSRQLVWRDWDHPQELEVAAAYIEKAFREAGGRVSSQAYPLGSNRFRNVLARFGPEEGPRLVIGAHYDAFGMLGRNPGADDNASGTAGLLELARLLGKSEVSLAVELVAFSTEEPPGYASDAMGSLIHAVSLREEGVAVAGMICLEMIGFYTEHQAWPSPLLRAFYPNHGRFVAVVGQFADRRLARTVKAGFQKASSVPVYSFSTPLWMPGLDASDHRSYWAQGYEAVMVTDTAFFRNPNYHTVDDRPETLDYENMAEVVEGLLEVVTGSGDWGS